MRRFLQFVFFVSISSACGFVCGYGLGTMGVSIVQRAQKAACPADCPCGCQETGVCSCGAAK